MKATQTNSNEEIVVLEMGGNPNLPADYLKNYFTHILCQEGTARFRMENRNCHIEKNDIVICLPAIGIRGLKFSEDFKATCLFVSEKLINMNNPDVGWGIKGYLFSKEHPVVHLSEMDVKKCLANFKSLYKRYKSEQHRFGEEILNRQVQIFVMEMWDIFSRGKEQRRINSQKGPLFERFLQLVQEHCMEEREVDFYAEKLFITSKYLTEVCKKSSTKTASEWIQNYTTQRLIIFLDNKELGFAVIAEKLNFSSPSCFSRYVRKVLGVSPSAYRERLGDA